MTPGDRWSKLDEIVGRPETPKPPTPMPEPDPVEPNSEVVPPRSSEAPTKSLTIEQPANAADDQSTELSPTWEALDASFGATLGDPVMQLNLSEFSEQIGTGRSSNDKTFGELSRFYWEQLSTDYSHFYSPQDLVNLAVGFTAGAAMANTNFDESVSHDFFRENFVDIANEDLTEKLHQPKLLGDGYILLPLIGGTALAEPWLEDYPALQPIGEWGNRSARAILVGGPFVLVMQRIVGGSRPNESPSLSHWEPFQDNNGVSGHSFVGAVPFLTIAQMTDNKLLKVLCWAGSVLPGVSRINDERHYFSQVFLGWYVAFLASRAVDQTQTGGNGFSILPTFDQNGFGLIFEKRF